MNVNDVVQFNENHKWCGSLGIITEKKEIHNNDLNGEENNDIRFMVGVPIPQQGTAYIYVLASEFSIELIGKAVMITKENTEE